MATQYQTVGIVAIICFLMCPSIFSFEKYVIVPSSDYPCPEDPCLTLSQFADNLTTYVDGNDTVLIFKAGNHSLDSEISIKHPSLNTLSMIASSRSPTTSAVAILCSKYARFTFSHVKTVKINGLNFVGCAGNKIESVDHFIAEESSFTGQQENLIINTALDIEKTNAEIVNVSFKHNGGKFRRQKRAGGAIVCIRCKLFISKCLFENNTANIGGAIYREHGASHHNDAITIINSTFIGNQALPYNGQYSSYCNCDGGAIFAYYGARIFISGSTFINNIASNKGGAFALHNIFSYYGLYHVIINNSEFTNNIAQRGGALWWVSTLTDIEINASRFRNNSAHHGGVVYIDRQSLGRVVLSNNRFTANNAIKGGVLMVSPHYTSLEHETIDIIKSIFERNVGKHDGGVFYLKNTHISLTDSNFIHNQLKANSTGDIVRFGHGGVFYTYDRTVLTVARATFVGNTATFGGVHWAGQFANISYINITFDGNAVHIDGGVFHMSHYSQLNITAATFSNNRAKNFGGVLHIDQSETNIRDSNFFQNIAGNDGGVMQLHQSTAQISNAVYAENCAENEGGVFHSTQSRVIVNGQTLFANNKARAGGVVWADRGLLVFTETLFVNNTARIGGVMVIDRATVNSQASRFTNNHANYSSLYITESIAHWSSVTFVNNTGSLCVLESTVTLTNMIMTNIQPFGIQKSTHKLHEGGAITAFQSKLIFDEKSYFTRNHAHSGGAIQAIETKIHIHGTVTIANNTAVKNGGGADIYQSEIICRQGGKLNFLGNTAVKEGGALHAVGSSIKVKLHGAKSLLHTTLNFEGNRAEKGGALFLAMDAKMYLLKSEAIWLIKREEAIKFTANIAKYGGAVYISDKGVCAISTEDSECPIQMLVLHSNQLLESESLIENGYQCQHIYYHKNTATVSGNSLYGGLLDRCIVNHLAEVTINTTEENTISNTTTIVGGLEYFYSISNIRSRDIGSPPVRVCFCRDGQPDCTYNPGPVPIRRGQLTEIPLSLAALDQINRPIESTIYNRLGSGDELCQHHIQTNDGNCSVINFTASFNETGQELILLIEGPCKEKANSQVRLQFEVYCPTCSVGFELIESKEGCHCDCDTNLHPYFSDCHWTSNAMVRDTNSWIAYVNTSNGSEIYQYLIHPHCPLDYCHPSSSRVEINLNLANGSDAQCANGRTGLICGTCQPGLSLSLGSSHCVRCPSHWPASLTAIIIAALLAGILLVVFILLLNLTVAVGTLNAIIFYANVLGIKNGYRTEVLPSSVASLLVSWLNLEAGFNACFFEGMDAFWKSLLQLGFPVYIISLVILTILISEHSSKFSSLIAKRNPVATLATLILLSYTKLLNTVITSLSFTVLHYPDGSQQTVWLADASIDYLRGKHLVLFTAAIVILIMGILYTAVLLFWQWFLIYQNYPILKWTKYQKLHHFIEPYHAPYVSKHRYWTGLLLLSRALLYLISAINTTGDPRVTIFAISFITGSLLLLKGLLAKVYQNRINDVIETIVILTYLLWLSLHGTPSTQAKITLLLSTSLLRSHLFSFWLLLLSTFTSTPIFIFVLRTAILLSKFY